MPGLLERRLGRLRDARSGFLPGGPDGQRAAIEASAGKARASALAGELGGRVLETAHGPVAVVEGQVALPIEHEALSRLPYPFEPGRPLVCLDLETTGLGTGAGTLPFLVGIGTWQEATLSVRQLILADHADEPALLSALAQWIPADSWLVTYNGRSFDWPLLVTRYRLHRRDPPALAGHLDLLPVARQLWRHRLDDARLATVERHICGVRRQGDLPGALIPERYFAYLRSRRADLLRDVLDHNRQDIVSLGLLLAVLAGQAGRPEQWPAVHPGDLLGLSRGFVRRRRHTEALHCVEAALGSHAWGRGVAGGGPLRRRLASDRARLLARLGRRDASLLAWLELAVGGGPGSAVAWIHVARHREHVEHDHAAALEACRAASGAAERSRLWGRPLVAVERDLARRTARLQRRAAAATGRERPAVRAAS